MSRRSKPSRAEVREFAAVGIGTMIVFIATVLVAAVAAGVLIDMSGKLQSRTQTTGEESTAQVASNLRFESIQGIRTDTTQSNLTYLHMYISLAPGAIDVDLAQMRIQVQTTATLVTLNYSEAASPEKGQFIASDERDADDSFTTSTPTMTQGDLVLVNVTLTNQGLDFQPRTDIILRMIPEVGVSVQTDFDTPNSYGSRLVVDLQ